MPTFAYVLKDHDGRRIEDMIRAVNVEAAVESLRKKGSVVSVKEIRAELAEEPSIAEQLALTIHRWRTRVPLKTLVFFTRQLSTMFSAGLTLEKSLSNLLAEEKGVRFRRVLARVNTDLKKGMSLSDSLAQHPGVFNNLYVALVHAGEISGSLHVILEQLSNYLESVAETRRKVISALSYPVFALCFLSIALTVIMLFIIPLFQDVYTKLGGKLPGPTRVLVGISHAISHNLLVSLGIFLLVIACLWFISMTRRGGYVLDTVKLRFPVFGNLIMNSLMNRFAKTFGILVGSGVPMLESIDHVYRVVGNRVIQRGLKNAKAMVKDGFAVSVAMKKSMVFPPTLVQLIATGEETGEMDKLLDKAAYFYEKQVDAIVDRLTSLIEPLLILLIGVVIGTIVVCIYLPIFYLGRTVLRSGF
jgi:type IV pilus assembly protein PilC